MKCPKCSSLVIHTYTTRLDDIENVQLRYNICENRHTFPTVELIGRWRTKDAKIARIELSKRYDAYLQSVDRVEEMGSVSESTDIP